MKRPIFLGLLALAGCEKSPVHYEDRIQIADANARTALNQGGALSSRIDELESEKADLESRLESVEAKLSEVESKADSIQSEVELLNSRISY